MMRLPGLIRATTCGNIIVMKAVWNLRKKIIGVIAIGLLMMLMMNINSRLTEYFRLSAERDELRTQLSIDLATR